MQKWFLIICVVLAGVGCSRHALLVNVDAIASPDALQKKRYVLIPADPEVNPRDLQWAEYASFANKTLMDAGFEPRTSYDDADVAIMLSYKLSEPQTIVRNVTVPVIGQTGISSSTTYGTLRAYGNAGYYSGTTTYTPTYGVTGYVNQTKRQTIYHRSMQLDAYDIDKFRKEQTTTHVWKAAALSSGSSADLRRVLPYMAVALKSYLGASTGHQIKVKVAPDHPYLESLTGMPGKAFNDR